jgi:hypothetical protein
VVVAVVVGDVVTVEVGEELADEVTDDVAVNPLQSPDPASAMTSSGFHPLLRVTSDEAFTTLAGYSNWP